MKIDFLTPSQLQYPGLQIGACQQGSVVGSALIQAGAFQPAPRDGLFNSMFTPDDLPYPLPIIQQAQVECPTNQGNAPATIAPQQSTAPGAPATSAAPASTTTAPAPSTEAAPTLPQQIIINVSAAAPAAQASCPAAVTSTDPATSAPSTSGTNSSVTTTAPVAAAPAAPSIAAPAIRAPINGMPVLGSTAPAGTDKIVTAYALNPRLRSRAPKAQEQLLEEWLGEQISLRMLTAQSAPVAFVVPDGFNAVDFYFGTIELNPEHGESDDLDQIVTLGDVKLSANAQPGSGALNAGDQITVTMPWRYASWVEMAPEHLRVAVTARFYTIENF